jgi:tRNA pseudouridine38-40 synthase
MVIQYDGTSYNGWQKQGNTGNTIQATIEDILFQLLQEDIEIHGSGRTDAGVHAYGQTANFKCNPIHDLDVFLCQMNHKLPEDIRINRIHEVDMKFHARLSAVSKRYQYNINNSERPSVFRRKYVYNYEKKLDIESMRHAAGRIVGIHDFRGFSSEKNTQKSCVRNLYEISIETNKNEIILHFFGEGFIYNMVRIITGTLIEIGAGERSIDDIDGIFKTGKREMAGFMAPPAGLLLKSVQYEENL